MHQQTIITPFLESILTSSGADGAYVYHFETDGLVAQLAAWAGPPPDPAFTAIEGRISREHFERESPLVLHNHAWSDRRFAAFPEFSVQLFAGVVSIPLTHRNTRIGLLNVCRLQPSSLAAGEAAFLFGLSLPLGALLASTGSRRRRRADREIAAGVVERGDVHVVEARHAS